MKALVWQFDQPQSARCADQLRRLCLFCDAICLWVFFVHANLEEIRQLKFQTGTGNVWCWKTLHQTEPISNSLLKGFLTAISFLNAFSQFDDFLHSCRCANISRVQSTPTYTFECANMTGRRVFVLLPQSNKTLSLCEVEVYGYEEGRVRSHFSTDGNANRSAKTLNPIEEPVTGKCKNGFFCHLTFSYMNVSMSRYQHLQLDISRRTAELTLCLRAATNYDKLIPYRSFHVLRREKKLVDPPPGWEYWEYWEAGSCSLTWPRAACFSARFLKVDVRDRAKEVRRVHKHLSETWV